jgi:hypothetical protein
MPAARQNWLDDSQQSTLIGEYTEKLTSFVDALADGRIDKDELEAQEIRLVETMKVVEPMLSDEQHTAVTQLLCELTAFNVMQMLNSLESSKPQQSQFRG